MEENKPILPEDILFVMSFIESNHDCYTDEPNDHEPYYYEYYLVAAGHESDRNYKGATRLFEELSELMNFLRPFSGRNRIVATRHPLYPPKADIEGDVEFYKGVVDEYKIQEAGIKMMSKVEANIQWAN